MKIGRNDPCPCGSGKRYKKCCGTLTGHDENHLSTVPVHPDENAYEQVSQQVKRGREKALSGKGDEALACYQNALRQIPDCIEAYDALGDLYAMHRQEQQALSAYKEVIRLNPDYPAVHYKCGTMYLELGRFHEAIATYLKALSDAPEDANILTNMGSAFLQTQQYDKATRYLQKALEINPEDIFAYQNCAASFIHQNNFAAAEKVLLRGLSIIEDQIDLCIMLASVYMKWRNQIEKACMYAEKILKQEPLNPAANVIIVSYLRRQKKTDEGLALLSKIEIPDTPLLLARTIHFELGLLHDQLNHSDIAMKHFLRANKLWAEETSISKNNYLQLVKSIRNGFKSNAKESITAIKTNNNPQEFKPIFMVGFPRSGTTLLNQILDSHPALEVLEEIPFLEVVLKKLEKRGGNFSEIVLNLREEELEDFRRLYYREVTKYIQSSSIQFVDKFPLNIVYCNLIARLFPESRIIVSLRHPCDVCLSCLMQDFDENDAMANFTTLEDTVQLYVEVMGLWLEYERILPVSFQRLHYERLIENFEQEVTAVVDFLDIPWSDNFYQFYVHAARKETITTPSYSQVVQPLYTSAKFRWLRYYKYLQPHLPALRPFIEAFGYEEQQKPADLIQ